MNSQKETIMKQFSVFGKGMDIVLTEAEVVRMGYKHSGVIGLNESISAFESAGIAIIEGIAGSVVGGAIGGDIGTMVAPGVGTKIGQTVGSAIGSNIADTMSDDETDETMTEGMGDFLKSSLAKLKGGKISDDEFDKYYADRVASGDIKQGSRDIRSRDVSGEGMNARGMNVPSIKTGTHSLGKSFDTVEKMADKKDSALSTVDRAKKVDNYRKMFRMDMGKFKKIFEIAPELVDEFKSFIDNMVSVRDKQFASLSEAEQTAPATAPAQPAKVAPKAPVATAPAVAQPVAPAPAPAPAPQPAPSVQAQAPATAPAPAPKVTKFQEPTGQPTVNDVLKPVIGAKGLATVQKRNAPVTGAAQKAGQVAQNAINKG